MPVVFRYEGFRFYFYSDEGDPREPVHIHVRKAGTEAKFWLGPAITVAYNDGFNARTLRELLQYIELRRAEIEMAWNEHFGIPD